MKIGRKININEDTKEFHIVVKLNYRKKLD